MDHPSKNSSYFKPVHSISLAKHNNFGYAIKSLIEQYGINQKQAADQVGVSPSEMSNILLRHQRSPAKVSAIIELLPKSEMDRAFLQKALALESVRNHGEPSPHLIIDTDDVATDDGILDLKRILDHAPARANSIRLLLKELSNPSSPHWKMANSIASHIDYSTKYRQGDMLRQQYPRSVAEDRPSDSETPPPQPGK